MFPMSDRTTVPFGPSRRQDWLLDPSITYLNHGTVGAPPTAVIEEQRRIQAEIERQPSAFLLRELSAVRVGADVAAEGRMRRAAAAVARRLGAAPDNLVFVDNATAGANVVFRSSLIRSGDEIAHLDLAYGGIVRAACFAARERGATVREIVTRPPYTPAHVADAVSAQLTDRTRLVVIDHITAETAFVLPIADIVSRCHSRGVLVFIDGAHAPGAVPVDIESTGADFYAANLHKWAWAPRSAAILCVRPEHQHALHPPVVSWGLDQGFTTEFDWVGTRDPSPFLTAPFAFERIESFGADRVRRYNHALAWRAAHMLSERWHTPFETPEDMIGTMVSVPLPEALGSTPEAAARLRDALLFEDHLEVQLHAWRDRLWVRVSAQIYTDESDIDRLAIAALRRLPG